MKKYLSLSFVVALLSGCASNIKSIGRIGDTAYYKLHCRSADGPNSTTLFALRDGDTQPHPVTSVGGPGIGAALIGAGGNVAASVVFGMSIRPDRNSSAMNINANTSASANSASDNHVSGSNHNRVDNSDCREHRD